jgi:hypothetical protein
MKKTTEPIQLSTKASKISKEQTERLYRFTREHFVEHYDLQTELVDHLAQGIEKQWQEHPTLDFEKALQNEFKKFGIFGFSDVVAERQMAMSKRYHKFIWHHFKEYFKLPKILMTLSAMLVLFGVFSQIQQYRELVFFGVFILYVVFYIMVYRKSLKKNKPDKIWMMAEMIHQYGAGSSIMPIYLQLPAQLSIHAPEALYHPVVLAFYCVLMVLFFIINHIMLYVIPQKAEDYLRETYPEYDFAV